MQFSVPSSEPKTSSEINTSYNSTEVTENSGYHNEGFEQADIETKSEITDHFESKLSIETKEEYHQTNNSYHEETLVNTPVKKIFAEPSESVSVNSLDIPPYRFSLLCCFNIKISYFDKKYSIIIIIFTLRFSANKQVESPRVPKRLNKKAAPPIPTDANKFSSLDRSLSSRIAGGNRVMVERAQSYVEKPVTKPPIVRKAESATTSSQCHGDEVISNSFATFKADPSGISEEALIQIGHRSPVSTLDRIPSTKKNDQTSDNTSHSPIDLSAKFSGGESSSVCIDKRSSLERPSSHPPLPPEGPLDKSKSVSIESSKSGSSDYEIVPEPEKSNTPSIERLSFVSNELSVVIPKSEEEVTSVSVNSANEIVKINDSVFDSPPERPPRSHSPNITVISEEKQFCTVIQLPGEPEKNTSPPVKVKPARPPYPPPHPPVKPRPTSSSNEQTYL